MPLQSSASASSSTTTNNNKAGPSASSSVTFEFKSPTLPASASALKHRRVSLALPSSPKVVQAWNFRDDTGIDAGPAPNTTSTAASSSSSGLGSGSTTTKTDRKGKVRKVVDTLAIGGLSTSTSSPSSPVKEGSMHVLHASAQPSQTTSSSLEKEKKPRKKWSSEETNMLVKGCQIHGVGNWKTILQDTTLNFRDRTAVDLKDRFRTYFPDAYKQHYPNAKTHLSSKVRSTLPDGRNLFEKTRSKRRRPFTEEEDRALKAGYEKHGTTWATIVKDPIFQEQNRRSTDLRDRFRNAFPHLYQAAGYKPRSTSKKKLAAVETGSSASSSALLPPTGGVKRAATDDQLAMSSHSSTSGLLGPVRSRRRAHTSQGILLRGGTKSVPQSLAPSEDEDSNTSAGEEESESSHHDYSYHSGGFDTTPPPMPVFVENVSTGPSTSQLGSGHMGRSMSFSSSFSSSMMMMGNSPSISSAAASMMLSSKLKKLDVDPFIMLPGPLLSAGTDKEGEQDDITIDIDDTSNPHTSPNSNSTSNSHNTATRMGMSASSLDSLTEPLNIPDFLPSEAHEELELDHTPWSVPGSGHGSGTHTPTHSHSSSRHDWSTAAASPTSSQFEDYLMNHDQSSSSSSPCWGRKGDDLSGSGNASSSAGGDKNKAGGGNIGKSAWGAHDWFSPNPRLDTSTSSSASSGSFLGGTGGFSPTSPFSPSPVVSSNNTANGGDLFPGSPLLGLDAGAGFGGFGAGSSGQQQQQQHGAGGTTTASMNPANLFLHNHHSGTESVFHPYLALQGGHSHGHSHPYAQSYHHHTPNHHYTHHPHHHSYSQSHTPTSTSPSPSPATFSPSAVSTSAFSEEVLDGTASLFKGYHSQIAGDLMTSGNGRMFPVVGFSSLYGLSGFGGVGSGRRAGGGGALGLVGLGLEGVGEGTGLDSSSGTTDPLTSVGQSTSTNTATNTTTTSSSLEDALNPRLHQHHQPPPPPELEMDEVVTIEVDEVESDSRGSAQQQEVREVVMESLIHEASSPGVVAMEEDLREGDGDGESMDTTPFIQDQPGGALHHRLDVSQNDARLASDNGGHPGPSSSSSSSTSTSNSNNSHPSASSSNSASNNPPRPFTLSDLVVDDISRDSADSSSALEQDDEDDDGQHLTPPATPIISKPRPMRRSSGSMLHSFGHNQLGFGGSGGWGGTNPFGQTPQQQQQGQAQGGYSGLEGVFGDGHSNGNSAASNGNVNGNGQAQGFNGMMFSHSSGSSGSGGGGHARSVSVPPSEARIPFMMDSFSGMGFDALDVAGVGVHGDSMWMGVDHFGMGMGAGGLGGGMRGGAITPPAGLGMYGTTSSSSQGFFGMRGAGAGDTSLGSLRNGFGLDTQQQQQQQQQQRQSRPLDRRNGTQHQQQQHIQQPQPQQPTTVFPGNLMLASNSVSSGSATASSASSVQQNTGTSSSANSVPSISTTLAAPRASSSAPSPIRNGRTSSANGRGANTPTSMAPFNRPSSVIYAATTPTALTPTDVLHSPYVDNAYYLPFASMNHLQPSQHHLQQNSHYQSTQHQHQQQPQNSNIHMHTLNTLVGLHGLGDEMWNAQMEEARQGQALDLAQSAALASSSLGSASGGWGTIGGLGGFGAFGLQNGGSAVNPAMVITPSNSTSSAASSATTSSSLSSNRGGGGAPDSTSDTSMQFLGMKNIDPNATIRIPRRYTKDKRFLDRTQIIPGLASSSSSSSASSSSVPSSSTSPTPSGAVAPASVTGDGDDRSSAVGGMRGSSGLGRSMSHHRGQSATSPQDVMMLNDDYKRKRASWDGGLV